MSAPNYIDPKVRMRSEYRSNGGPTAQSTRNSPNLLTATSEFHEIVVLNPLLESPGQEEHVHLEQVKAATSRQGSVRTEGTSYIACDLFDYAPGRPSQLTAR